jgi:hypothetical protein
MLRQLGWVEVMKGARPTPRNTELRLRPTDELLAMRKELLHLQKNARMFIARVFGSRSDVWVERCSSIVVDDEASSD